MNHQYPAHTLLWVEKIVPSKSLPPWYRKHDPCRPVVVRRSIHKTLIPIGIRGESREERLAGWVDPKWVIKYLLPQEIVALSNWDIRYQYRLLKQFLILTDINNILSKYQLRWGIGGSIGFELATDMIIANEKSDLDLIIYMPVRYCDKLLFNIWNELISLSEKIDIQIETNNGAFALKEWIYKANGMVMLKTSSSAYLTKNPW